MGRRRVTLLVLVVAAACRRDAAAPPAPTEAPPPREVAAESPANDVTAEPPRNDVTAESSQAAPAPLEVVVAAEVLKGGGGDAPALVVDVDPRFRVRVRVLSVEPATRWLTPGVYELAIHSPARTFRGGAPRAGARLRLRLVVAPPAADGQTAGFSGLRVE